MQEIIVSDYDMEGRVIRSRRERIITIAEALEKSKEQKAPPPELSEDFDDIIKAFLGLTKNKKGAKSALLFFVFFIYRPGRIH